VDDTGIEELARALELADHEFRALYTRRLRGGDLSLREKRNGDCVFYDRREGCRVYAWRPRQCRTWPFWRAVVHSRERWDEEAQGCPGMNHGPLRTARWIERVLADDGAAAPARPSRQRSPRSSR
jgi:Fe-S-cluster containining protein